MFKGENVICISCLVWDSIPLVMHHMMTRLARDNRVLFVDPPVAYSNLIIQPDWWKNHLRKKLSAMEANLTRKADIVFATSKYLFNLRKMQNPNTYYLPSGIDFTLFNKSISSDCKIAPELEAISKPIIGFVGGMVNSKMNWEWIRRATGFFFFMCFFFFFFLFFVCFFFFLPICPNTPF